MRRAILLIMFLTALLGISSMWAATINVPGDYTTIQAAINAASPGDVIQVSAGTYTENAYSWTDIMINKPISLIGAGSGSTIVELNEYNNPAGSHMDGVSIAASDVLIQGFTFTKKSTASYGTGYNIRAGINVNPQPPNNTFFNIVLRDVISTYSQNMNVVFSGPYTYNNVVIDNCAINYAGDRNFYETPGATINGLTVTDSEFNFAGQVIPGNTAIGFNLQGDVSNLVVTGCDFSNNPGGGINLDRSVTGTNSITDCTVTSSGTNNWDRSGISVWTTGTCENLTIDNCFVTNSGGRGIMLGTWGANTLNNISVENCEITGSGNIGFMIYEGGTDPVISNITFDNNSVSGSHAQGVLIESDGGTMSNVDVTNSNIAAGLNTAVYYLDYGGTFTGENNVTNNVITDIASPYSGLRVYGLDAANILVTDNSFSGTGGYGVNFTNGTETFAAQENFWGDATGPTHVSNPGGTGLLVSDNVVFDPWWADYLVLLGSNAPVENVTQNTYYQTIQAAINDADDNDEIHVAAGTYTENININRCLTLNGVGSGESETVITPLTAGVPVVRISASGVSDTDRLTISNIRVTGGNGGSGTYENSGIKFENSFGSFTTLSNVTSVANQGSGLLARAGTLEYVEVLNCNFSDNGAQGFLASGSTLSITSLTITNSIMNHNLEGLYISCSLNGLELTGGNYDYNYANADPTNGVGIYIFGQVSPPVPTNPINLSGFHADHNKRGVVINKFFGPVSISNAFASNNSAEGISVSPGRNVTDLITFSNITADNNTNSNLWVISYLGFNVSNVVIDNCRFNGSAGYGLYLYAAANAALGVNVTDCTLIGNDTGIWARGIGVINATTSGNTLTDNVIQILHTGATVWNMNAFLPPANTYDSYFVLNQVIYSTGAEMLYVDAPKQLIKDNEMQIYSVKALHIEHLRGYTVQVKIPKADFATAPTNFAVGGLFGGDAFFEILDNSDASYWIYDVSGSMMGGIPGITGDNVVLFTFEAISTTDWDNISVPGCWITLPLSAVVLKDDQNPYHAIPCVSTEGKFVLIDATEPTITIDNLVTYTNGMTLLIDPALTVTNGYPSVAIPLLSLDYLDNYNLDYSRYLLVASGGTVPTTVAEFASATLLFGPAYAGATYDNLIWNDPNGALNSQLNILPDGTYTLYFLAVDDAGNFVITPWTFVIDKTASGPIIWEPEMTNLLHPCRTTPNANNSIDLMWTQSLDVVNNHIWVLSYGSLGSGATGYPEYDPTTATIPAAPNPYIASPQNGWTKMAAIPKPTTFPYALTGLQRGYYYVTIFAEDANGNMSTAPDAPFYRESISYWPGDVVVDGSVVDSDIGLLSGAWGKTSAWSLWNPELDVGPSTDYARRSRPTPDNKINIEDLMMFAMNYYNTDYSYYPRNFPEANAITIAMNVHSAADQLTVTLDLGGNTGFVKGLDLPIRYGNGLQLLNVASGEIWPEGSLMLHTDADGLVTVSGATLGADPTVSGNGNIVTLTFAIIGNNTGLSFEHMIARTWDNQEIEIVNNPGASTANDDLVNLIPDTSYLGKNFPNPFNPSTTIQYGLKEPGSVVLSVFNARGQLIRSLVNDTKAAGTYQIVWNGLDNSNRPVSSGVYFFRMEASGTVKTTKGLLIK